MAQGLPGILQINSPSGAGDRHRPEELFPAQARGLLLEVGDVVEHTARRLLLIADQAVTAGVVQEQWQPPAVDVHPISAPGKKKGLSQDQFRHVLDAKTQEAAVSMSAVADLLVVLARGNAPLTAHIHELGVLQQRLLALILRLNALGHRARVVADQFHTNAARKDWFDNLVDFAWDAGAAATPAWRAAALEYETNLAKNKNERDKAAARVSDADNTGAGRR